MATMQKVRCVWQNWPGAPGYTNFFIDSATPVPTSAIASFWTALAGMLPLGLTVTTPSTGDVIDAPTGQIAGSWSSGTTATATGSSSQVYSGGSGAVINWTSNTVLQGRRVRGRSFIVPITMAFLDTNGSLASSAITTLTNAANGLITAAGGMLLIYHRPTTFSGGATAPVTGCRVPDLAAVLRSRRI